MQRPIEHCYWVIPGKLLAGEYPGAVDPIAAQEKVKTLIKAGVGAFIDLTEPRDGLMPYAEWVAPATYQRFGIRDVSIPDSPPTMLAILDCIEEHLASGRMVYVHCWGGVGRTGVVVGCWLTRHGFHGEEAVERLADLWKQCPKSVRRKSPETMQQVDYIRSWREESPPLNRAQE
ncbi:MAG: protein-tyrosine phosphatase family protein [Planctomycetota bacterium]